MKKLLIFIVLALLLFAGAPDVFAQQKYRVFTGTTGGTSGKLDAIPIAGFTNNDPSVVIDKTTKTVHFYLFDSSATDAEVDPYFVRPDDYSTAGVHILASAFSFGRSATPKTIWREAGLTAFDDNVYTLVDCTDEGDGYSDISI
jgi:hypothetical protein